MKDHSISVDQARYATSIVAKYLDTATFKAGANFYKTALPYDMILTKPGVYTKKFTWNIFPKLSTNHFPRASKIYQ